MNLPSLPKTERTHKSDFWPTVIKYRAFTAGQQTMLLQVADPNTPMSERVATLEQLFDSCVDSGVPFSKLPIGVTEEVFLKMRCISIGEVMKIRYKCNNKVQAETNEGGEEPVSGLKDCGQELVLPIPLNQVKCVSPEGFRETFDLPGGYHIKMRQPSFSDASVLNEASSVEQMIATFIDCLYDDDGQVWKVENPAEPGIDPEVAKERQRIKDEFVKWVGDNIESEIVQDISNDFFKKIPRIRYATKIKCPSCGKEHEVKFNSVTEIFI
ncbi:baseplate hub [Salmonella phage SeF6a]|nr:baseplate hub [Salmonella phage SeF6a]